MTDDRTYSVYKHTTPSGKVYIGMSCDPIRRWANGHGYAHNVHFDNAIKKYGWDNITHEILYEGLSEDEAKEIERDLIKEYNAMDRRFGYNHREGGEGGGKFSEDVIRRISEANKGKPNHGREKQVCIVDEYENILRVYNSIRDANLDTGCNWRKISACCLGKCHTTDGLIWRYYNAEDNTPDLTHKRERKPPFVPQARRRGDHPSARPVVEIDLDGQIVATFDSITSAALEYDLDISEVAKCCKGKRKRVKKHIFKYLSEIDQPQADFFIA